MGAILGVSWAMLGYLGRIVGHVGAILETLMRYLAVSRGVWGGLCWGGVGGKSVEKPTGNARFDA